MANEALYYGTGRHLQETRWRASSRSHWQVTINGRDGGGVLRPRGALFNFCDDPFKVTDTTGHFDVKAHSMAAA